MGRAHNYRRSLAMLGIIAALLSVATITAASMMLMGSQHLNGTGSTITIAPQGNSSTSNAVTSHHPASHANAGPDSSVGFWGELAGFISGLLAH